MLSTTTSLLLKSFGVLSHPRCLVRTLMTFKQGMPPRPTSRFPLMLSHSVRSLRSGKQKGTVEESYEDVEEVMQEEEEEYDPLPPGSARPNTRVKVKFDWKNSLVTAGSVKLLENLYQTYPDLVEIQESDLLQYLERMSVFSMNVSQASELLLTYPPALSTPYEKFASCISTLRAMGMREKQYLAILRRIPPIIHIPSKKLAKQISFLNTYLPRNETLEVILNSVQLLVEPENSLKQKLEYLIKSMSHETKDITACKALAHPFKHMRVRHEFLIRAGIFKPIPYSKMIKVLEKEHKDKSKPRNKYYKPIEIVCYDDEKFLRKCTNNMLTLNELAAFEELFEAELQILDEGPVDDEMDAEDDENFRNAVSLITSHNSVGFFNESEGRSCYF